MEMNVKELLNEGGTLPARAPYPLIYISLKPYGILCNNCALEHIEEINEYHCYFEGPPIECDGGCGEFIESAYGDPEAEDQ